MRLWLQTNHQPPWRELSLFFCDGTSVPWPTHPIFACRARCAPQETMTNSSAAQLRRTVYQMQCIDSPTHCGILHLQQNLCPHQTIGKPAVPSSTSDKCEPFNAFRAPFRLGSYFCPPFSPSLAAAPAPAPFAVSSPRTLEAAMNLDDSQSLVPSSNKASVDKVSRRPSLAPRIKGYDVPFHHVHSP